MKQHKHCDDYIDDPEQPECLRRFLDYNRLPAILKCPAPDWLTPEKCREQYGREPWEGAPPVLFADHKGERIRVVMASRFGDVGITSNLASERGYSLRVLVDELTNFSDAS